jgi:YD repeat-containing protein
MKKLLLSIFAMLFCAFYLNAQELPQLTPPSPTAYQLTKYGDVNVNESSGAANFNIPLLTITSGDLSIPVSLSHTTSGVKVNQIASWVGMGWDLNAGGVITRSVKGLADDLNQRAFTTLSNVSNLKANNLVPGFLNLGIDILEGSDYQPDIYTFNIGGFSGSFYIDQNSTPQFLKKENEVKIEKTTNGFILTAPNGTVYHFDGTGEFSRSESLSSGSSGHQNPSQLYQTSWLLTKISNFKGDEIYIKYDHTASYLYTTGFDQTIRASSVINSGGPGATLTTTSYKSYVQSKKVSEIYTNRNNSKIIFNATKSRSDLPSEYKLNSVELKDGNSLIKKYNLYYTFINSNKSYFGADNMSWLDIPEHFKRMFLSSVKETDSNGNETNGKTHSFEYDSAADLPPRMSFSQDLLGYYNGKQNNGYTPVSAGSTLGGYSLSGISRGDRSTDYNSAKKGVLTKITYPTKGYTIIEYEQGPSAVRVKKVKSLPKLGGVEKVMRYYYSAKENLNNSTYSSIFTFQFVENQEGENEDTYIMNSSSINHFYVTLPQSFMYSKVTVSIGDNFEGGGIEKQFHINSIPTNNVVWENPILNSSATTNMAGLHNGRLLKETHFEKPDGTTINLVSEKEYFYKDVDTYIDAFSARRRYLKTNVNMGSIQYLDGVDIESYKLYSRWSSIDSIATKNYFGNDLLLTTQKYIYGSSLAGLPTEIKTTNSKGETLKTENIYPSVGSTQRIQNRFDVVETKQYKNATLLSHQKTVYKNWGNNVVLPEYIKTAKGSQSLEDRIIFHSYDDKGNVKEASKKDGSHVVYLWGYNQTKPIAKIENITYSQIQSSVTNLQNLSNDDDDRTYGNAGKEGALRTALEALRNSLPSDAVMTYYTYDPLVGVTSTTDPRGRTTYYHYDAFGRLQYVRDHDNKILTNNQYNYKN